MAPELAYAVVTPYTLRKSRTGAVLARLLARTSTELVATQMFSLTRDFAGRYAESVSPAASEDGEFYRELIRDYIREGMGPDPSGQCRRVLMLVFKGKGAFADVNDVVGRLSISCTTGETIRDTYGDLVRDADGAVRYFEPAVLTAQSEETVAAELRLWLDYARTRPALLDNVCLYDCPEDVQKTLVLIKPDSWRQHSARPGAIVDMFSRTGLRIIGCKLCRMSVAQALEFYGPVRHALHKKLSVQAGRKARKVLEREFGFELSRDTEEELRVVVGVPYAEHQFERIIEFMTGRSPRECAPDKHAKPGKQKCLALVYEGESAVTEIRAVLGPTDPMQAPDGTVRREFGSDVMVNTAHASDSPENAEREMQILAMDEGNFLPIVEAALEDNG